MHIGEIEAGHQTAYNQDKHSSI